MSTKKTSLLYFVLFFVIFFFFMTAISLLFPSYSLNDEFFANFFLIVLLIMALPSFAILVNRSGKKVILDSYIDEVDEKRLNKTSSIYIILLLVALFIEQIVLNWTILLRDSFKEVISEYFLITLFLLPTIIILSRTFKKPIKLPKVCHKIATIYIVISFILYVVFVGYVVYGGITTSFDDDYKLYYEDSGVIRGDFSLFIQKDDDYYLNSNTCNYRISSYSVDKDNKYFYSENGILIFKPEGIKHIIEKYGNNDSIIRKYGITLDNYKDFKVYYVPDSYENELYVDNIDDNIKKLVIYCDLSTSSLDIYIGENVPNCEILSNMDTISYYVNENNKYFSSFNSDLYSKDYSELLDIEKDNILYINKNTKYISKKAISKIYNTKVFVEEDGDGLRIENGILVNYDGTVAYAIADKDFVANHGIMIGKDVKKISEYLLDNKVYKFKIDENNKDIDSVIEENGNEVKYKLGSPYADMTFEEVERDL